MAADQGRHNHIPPVPIAAPKPIYHHHLLARNLNIPPSPPYMIQTHHSLTRLDIGSASSKQPMTAAAWGVNTKTPPVLFPEDYWQISSMPSGPSPPPRPLPTVPLDMNVRTKSPVAVNLVRASPRMPHSFVPPGPPPPISTNTNVYANAIANAGSNASTPTSATNVNNSLVRPLPPIPPALRSRKRSGGPGGSAGAGASGSQCVSISTISQFGCVIIPCCLLQLKCDARPCADFVGDEAGRPESKCAWRQFGQSWWTGETKPGIQLPPPAISS